MKIFKFIISFVALFLILVNEIQTQRTRITKRKSTTTKKSITHEQEDGISYMDKYLHTKNDNLEQTTSRKTTIRKAMTTRKTTTHKQNNEFIFHNLHNKTIAEKMRANGKIEYKN